MDVDVDVDIGCKSDGVVISSCCSCPCAMLSGRAVVGKLRPSAPPGLALLDEDERDGEDGRGAITCAVVVDGESASVSVLSLCGGPAIDAGDEASRGSIGGLEADGVADGLLLPSSAIRAMDVDPTVSRLCMTAAAEDDAAPVVVDTVLLRSGAVVNELKLSCFGRCVLDVAGEEMMPFDTGYIFTSPGCV